jgi:phage shock protein PspC (stress-responsive transcriptional regulator)
MEDRLYRSRDDRIVAGVCGGLAERFDIDPSFVRIAWVLLGLITGVVPFFVLYVILAIAIPEAPPGFVESIAPTPPQGTAGAAAWEAARAAERSARRSARRAERARTGADRPIVAVLGVGLIAIGAALLLERWFGFDWAVLWPLAILAVGVLVIAGALRR